MKTLIPFLLSELAAGRPAALATVLISKGSAPRGAGACMALNANGTALGTVGGGVLEHCALKELRALLDRCPANGASPSGTRPTDAEPFPLPPGNPSHVEEYALTQDDVQNLGMVCGGNVSLLYQAFTPAQLPFFRAMQEALAAGGNLWFVRALAGGEVASLAFSRGVRNPTPLADAVFRAACARRAALVSPPGEPRTAVFVEPVVFESHAYIFGGGHVAQRVAPLLAQLDFAPVVYDDRSEFADIALFPGAAGTVCAPFAQTAERVNVTPDDEIVIMTRGHANDLDILTWALRTPAYYLGLIGSRSKVAHTRAMLLAQGFAEADFARVHTPIGLPIEAETPMEIAVSVAAEMILCRARQAEKNKPEA